MERIDYWLRNYASAKGVGMPLAPDDKEWKDGAGDVPDDELEGMQYGIDSIIDMAMSDEKESDDGG